MVTLPTTYTRKMSLRRGDLLKMYLDLDRLLVCEKVDLHRNPSLIGVVEQ
jgi:hypothetical protein